MLGIYSIKFADSYFGNRLVFHRSTDPVNVTYKIIFVNILARNGDEYYHSLGGKISKLIETSPVHEDGESVNQSGGIVRCT
jgi:hypothetical protein